MATADSFPYLGVRETSGRSYPLYAFNPESVHRPVLPETEKSVGRFFRPPWRRGDDDYYPPSYVATSIQANVAYLLRPDDYIEKMLGFYIKILEKGPAHYMRVEDGKFSDSVEVVAVGPSEVSSQNLNAAAGWLAEFLRKRPEEVASAMRKQITAEQLHGFPQLSALLDGIPEQALSPSPVPPNPKRRSWRHFLSTRNQ